MASDRSAQRRLLAALDRLEPALRREVWRALDALRASVSIDDLARAIETGNRLALERIASDLSRSLRRALRTVERAYEIGQASTANLSASLNQTNALARRAAERSAAQLVTGVTSETRKAIRASVAAAFERGLTPRETAQLVKPLIGLTERQANAVLNQRRRDAAAGIDADRISARADRYADRLLRQRAQMIARTEIMRASNDGQLDLWRQAQAQGFLPPATRKQWLVAEDDRLCPACEALSGETAPLDGEFVSGGLRVQGPPLHPNCRCTLVLAVQSARRAA